MASLTRQSGVPARIGTFLDAMRRLCNTAGFAYGMIFMLQMKVLWRVWDFKDISSGDTVFYYTGACVGLDRFRFNFAWTPLYALFGSIILRISHDPYFYCIATRVTLVLAITLLTLAVMRRLLPPLAAWLVAAWWAVLPIDFNTLYEVHLFAILPVLTTWLILLSDNSSRWKRGAALAIIVASAVLVRNEQTLYGAFFAVCLAIAEVRAYILAKRSNQAQTAPSTPGPEHGLRSILIPYLVPLILSICLIAAFFIRTSVNPAYLASLMRHKHTNNVGQIYCFGYQQRYPGRWNKSAWSEYGDLMTKDFGGPELTITEAAIRNPAAMAEHLAWNAHLIPDGLQLMLFNCISGTITPDYITPRTDFWKATVLSLLVLAVVTGGLLVAIRDRQWTSQWIRARSWGLTAIACYAPVAIIVMIIERPRASYAFAFTIAFMGLVGFCIWRLLARLLTSPSWTSRWSAWSPACSAIVSFALIAVTANYYPQHSFGRPLLDYVHFLQPFTLIIGSPKTKVLAPSDSEQIASYLFGASGSIAVGHWVMPPAIPGLLAPNADISKVLIANGVEHAIIDRPMLAPPAFDQLASAKEWRLIALQKLPARTLSLYTRSTLYDIKK